MTGQRRRPHAKLPQRYNNNSVAICAEICEFLKLRSRFSPPVVVFDIA